LRIAAASSHYIDPSMAIEKIAASGIRSKEMALEPSDPEPNASVIRQRRLWPIEVSRNVIAVFHQSSAKFQTVYSRAQPGGASVLVNATWLPARCSP